MFLFQWQSEFEKLHLAQTAASNNVSELALVAAASGTAVLIEVVLSQCAVSSVYIMVQT